MFQIVVSRPRPGLLRPILNILFSIFSLFLHPVTFIHSISQQYGYGQVTDTGGVNPLRFNEPANQRSSR